MLSGQELTPEYYTIKLTKFVLRGLYLHQQELTESKFLASFGFGAKKADAVAAKTEFNGPKRAVSVLGNR